MIDITFTQIAVMFVLCIVAGFIDSIAGGGGLISLTSYYAIGLPPVYALGNNKFSSTFGTLFATMNYARKKTIIWRVAIFTSIFALIGSSIGSNLALRFAGTVFRYVMLFVLPILTILTVVKPKHRERKRSIAINQDRKGNLHAEVSAEGYLLTALLGLVIGIYDGFFGPGTGMFYTLAFSFIGIPMIDACGTTKFVNLASNIAALTTFLINGNIIYKLGIPCVFASIIGNLLGSEFAIKKDAKVIKPVLVIVIVLLYIKIVTDII